MLSEIFQDLVPGIIDLYMVLCLSNALECNQSNQNKQNILQGVLRAAARGM